MLLKYFYLFNKLYKILKSKIIVINVKAVSLTKLNRWKEALEILEIENIKNFKNEISFINLFACQYKLKMIQKAFETVDIGISKFPDKIDIYEAKIYMCREEGMFNDAIKCYQTILALDPKRLDVIEKIKELNEEMIKKTNAENEIVNTNFDINKEDKNLNDKSLLNRKREHSSNLKNKEEVFGKIVIDLDRSEDENLSLSLSDDSSQSCDGQISLKEKKYINNNKNNKMITIKRQVYKIPKVEISKIRKLEIVEVKENNDIEKVFKLNKTYSKFTDFNMDYLYLSNFKSYTERELEKYWDVTNEVFKFCKIKVRENFDLYDVSHINGHFMYDGKLFYLLKDKLSDVNMSL